MRRSFAMVAVGILVLSDSVSAQDTLFDLRLQFAIAKTDGVSTAEFARLSERALVLADDAGSRGKFWNLIGFLAELCEAGPFDAVSAVRARSLGLLVRRFTDTHRWSSLVSNRFAPRLERIPRELWRSQLRSYDETLDALSESTGSDRIQAELMYAKVMLRVQINRRWDWLSEKDRLATLQLLKQIQDKYGTLSCPGSRREQVETVGARAAAHKYEITRLHFNAPAPRTAGSGGSYALAAGRALLAHSDLSAADIVRNALEIAGEICIYTNQEITVLELG